MRQAKPCYRLTGYRWHDANVEDGYRHRVRRFLANALMKSLFEFELYSITLSMAIAFLDETIQ
jgi:hypothetical protein